MGNVAYLNVTPAHDQALEDEIKHMRDLMVKAPRNDVASVYNQALAALIRLRSADQVARMERCRGLA